MAPSHGAGALALCSAPRAFSSARAARCDRRFSRDTAADTRIIECVYDPEWVVTEYRDGDDTWDVSRERRGGWKFERIREDKKARVA